jgi:hypothetical protein
MTTQNLPVVILGKTILFRAERAWIAGITLSKLANQPVTVYNYAAKIPTYSRESPVGSWRRGAIIKIAEILLQLCHT